MGIHEVCGVSVEVGEQETIGSQILCFALLSTLYFSFWSNWKRIEITYFTLDKKRTDSCVYLALVGTLVNGSCSSERSSAVSRRFWCVSWASLGELPPLLPSCLSLVLLLLTLASSGCSWVARCPTLWHRKHQNACKCEGSGNGLSNQPMVVCLWKLGCWGSIQ